MRKVSIRKVVSANFEAPMPLASSEFLDEARHKSTRQIRQKILRRIFIDCSAVDFAGQPTGIPRVVRKYLEVGYVWGARHGIEVIPVLPVPEGLALVWPAPGKGAPAELATPAIAGKRALWSNVLLKLRIVWHYLRTVLHHGLNFVTALVPVPPVRLVNAWLDHLLEDITSVYERYVQRKHLATVLFAPGPGDVLLAPAYWHDVDPQLYRALHDRGLAIVILVHDLLPIRFPQFYETPWRVEFRDNVQAAFSYASAFLCVSHLTKAALWEFGQRNKLDPVPMMIAYNGLEPLVSDAAAAEIAKALRPPAMGNVKLFEVLRREPLLMVGSVEPKKGHLPVVRCLEALWHRAFARPLLIIGRPGWMERDVVAALQGSTFFNKNLYWFPEVDDFDLATAYIFCHALIFGSLAEGFGIPMIEASHYGKPTIALDTPIVHEIMGNKAFLFSSAAGFVEHILDLEDAAKYVRACRVAASVRWPLWEEYTPRVFDRLADFVAGKAPLPAEVALAMESRPVPVDASAAQ